MRQILHNYKLRLTNLSQSNRSLKLARLSSRRDIDLKSLGFLEKDSAEDILQKIIADKDVRLINKLDARHEPTNLADRRLNNIFRQVNTIFEETGTYDLFIGYPFVEGKLIDGTVVRCPVLLFPVKLIRNLQKRPRWVLKRITDEPVEFNRTFFMAYEQFQQIRLKNEFWEEEIESSKNWREWLNVLYQKIKEYEIEVNFNPRLFDLKLAQFVDYQKATMDAFPLGRLKFKPEAILGIFPQSDSALLQDYQELEKSSGNYDLDQFFDFDSKIGDLPPPKQNYIREEYRYFVTSVDESQESALIDIKQGSSLVIHGPPGTGKSQVIVNIIADAMAHGKKVLLVSQKRAALDVVYKRLNALGLSEFAVLLHDYRHDRNQIYKKIRRQIDEIDNYKKEINDLNITKWEHDYKLLSRQADQYHRTFEDLFQALIHQNECGLSVHELYLSTDATANIFPVEEIARGLDTTQLERLVELIGYVYDYIDFYDPRYPWKTRLSFRHFTFDDKQVLSKKLRAISQQIDELNTLFDNLKKQAGKEILDGKFNEKAIAYFKDLDEKLQSPSIRDDIGAIYLDELKGSFIKKKFEQIEKVLVEIAENEILRDFPWTLYESLDNAVNIYKQQKNKTFKFLSIKYQKARWFLKKILEEKELALNAKNFQALNKEYRLLNRLHGHYVRTHDKAFFSDFPLLEGLEAQKQWLNIKYSHFQAFETIQKLPFLKELKPIFVFGRLDEEAWKHSIKCIQTLAYFNLRLSETTREWRIFLHPEQITTLYKGIELPANVSTYIKRLCSTFESDFSDLQQLDRTLANATSREVKALSILEPFLLEINDAQTFIGQVRNSIYFYWIEQIEMQNPILLQVSTRGWERKGKDFDIKLNARRKKVTELIQRRLKEQIVEIIEYNRLRNPITYRKIYHQVSKKRRLWPVRKLIKESWERGLQQLAPCWMASPESVAAIFPMQKDLFDVVIFDEASQCFVERAIPVMLRGKQVVIAGDDKQLQPLNLYTVRYEETEEGLVESDIALEVESVLDLAKTTFEERKLTWHYRSKEEELINFSNQAFYEGKLQVMPLAIHQPINHPPLAWVQVEGDWKNNRNHPEARRIITLLEELVNREDKPSIGIVTFNYHQQELIKDLLDQRLEELAQIDETQYLKLQSAMNQVEDEEFVGIFVKNIENVQGDERDIIIFSVGYGYNEKGRINTHFGLLNQRGGENRLNVAISRARQKIYVVCSFNPIDLKVDDSAHSGPRYFKQYLQYVKYVSEDRFTDALNILDKQSENNLKLVIDNPIADYVSEKLTREGFFCIRNLGDTSYKIDIAVKRSPDDKNFILAIECEGTNYFNGNSAKEREVYRKNLLKSRSWNIHRVWARNFWVDREKEVDKILKKIRE